MVAPSVNDLPDLENELFEQVTDEELAKYRRQRASAWIHKRPGPFRAAIAGKRDDRERRAR